MRVLVVAVVQDPRDARVAEREIGALVAAGHEVAYAAPFSDFGATPPEGVIAVDIPRARGRRRTAALRAARRVLRRMGPGSDVILLHNPEVLIATVGLRHPVIVWDVHEDTAAAVTMKRWLPPPLQRPAARVVRGLERYAERHLHLLLAEQAYAERFERSHPVVPNTSVVPERVPPTGRGRAVYVGTLTEQRGGDELIAMGRQLAPDVVMDVLGPAHGPLADRMQAANREGVVRWRGFVPNAVALEAIEGATVGLSMLHDEPNYRHSMPTKLYEYLARGVPFVSTPLPLACELAEASGGGLIVPFGDPDATAAAVRELDADDARRQAMADAGRRWVRDNADWRRDGEAFVAQLEAWARS